MGQLYTGERMLDFIEDINKIQHLHRYSYAMAFTEGKKVLDIACGDGYGSNLMASNAERVYGVDIDLPTVKEASEKYKKSNLTFLHGSATEIPMESNSIDVIVSFETIEHLEDHTRMMEECKRVLKTDGILLISTPDKNNYSIKRNRRNPFHLKELYYSEFKHLLSTYFSKVEFYFQHDFHGSFIFQESTNLSTKFITGTIQDINYLELKDTCDFIVALASNQPIEKTQFNSLFFDTKNWDLEKHYYEKVIESKNATIQNITSGLAFKIGMWVLAPIQFIRSLFSPQNS